MTLTRILADRLTTPDSARRKVSLCRVFVRDLVVSCSIGVHAHERDAPQRLRVNFDLSVREGGPIGDKLANVVDYERIVLGARSIGEGRHINLVETLAERIAGICLADPRVRLARVRVEKLNAFDDVGAVGIEIERRNRFA